MARFVAATGFGLLLVALVFLATVNTVIGYLGIALSFGIAVLVAFGIERTGTACVIAALFLAPMNDLRPVSAVSFLTFSDVFFALGFGLLIPVMLLRRTHLHTPFVVGGLIVVTMTLVASSVNPQQVTSLFYGSRLVASAVVLPLLFMVWRPRFRIIDWLAGAYVLGQVVNTFAAVLEGAEPINDRYDGLNTHPNFFGLCGLLGFALCFHLQHRVPLNRRWLVWGAMGITFLSIAMSGSRAALAAALLLVLLYPLMERSTIAGYLVITGGVVGAPFANWILGRFGEGSAVARLQGDRSTTTSDLARSEAFDKGVERFLDHPLLGNGFYDTPLGAHNIYLQVAVVVGVVGLLGFLLILWSASRPLLLVTHPMRRLGYATLAYISIGMISNSLWDRFVWAVIALVLLANIQDRSEDGDTDDGLRRVPETTLRPSKGS